MILRNSIFLTILLISCRVTKDYKNENILELKKDKNGTIVYKKVGKLYKTYYGDEYIISYQEFDSLGRRIKKYGFHTQNTNSKHIVYETGPNDKYLTVTHYLGNHNYLEETYVWPTSTDSNFTPSPQFLKSQNFVPDSVQKLNGSITIFIRDHKDSLSIGEYRKTKMVKPSLAEYSEWFLFEIPISKMKLDSIGILNIKDVTKTFIFSSTK